MPPASRYLPALLTSAVIAVNAAANILPINGYATGELSDLNPTGFTPAGWVFSIWGLIYLGLIVFSLFMMFAPPARTQRALRILPAYAVSSAANIGWIFAWHFRAVTLSFAIMLVLLAALTVIYRHLRRDRAAGWMEFALVDAPFRIYLGWVTTATIVNLATVFYASGFYPFGLTLDQWAIVSVAAAMAIYVWVGTATRDGLYCLVFVWASLGIYLKPHDISEPVRLTAITGAVLVGVRAVTAFAVAYRSRGRHSA